MSHMKTFANNSDHRIVRLLREVHGNKLLKYKDDELLRFYKVYKQSRLYVGPRSNNFLYFVW